VLRGLRPSAATVHRLLFELAGGGGTTLSIPNLVSAVVFYFLVLFEKAVFQEARLYGDASITTWSTTELTLG
jgi:hypothetical protein